MVAATSEEGSIVTNGMSEYSRMADNSNSAILVSVKPSDFASESPLAGIEYQEQIERQAYCLSSGYAAPAIALEALLSGDVYSASTEVAPSYPRGTICASPDKYMPEYISASIIEGMREFDAWLPGFASGGAVLTGPETRTTSPVRILRGESGECPTMRGLYPCGEGAGYAGGIVSSATDGLRMAEKLIIAFAKGYPC